MKSLGEQAEFFTPQGPTTHQLGNAELVEHRNAFSQAESARYFRFLLENINWRSAAVPIAGKLVPIPRLQCWIADPGLSYTYSGITMHPEGWSEPLLEIRERVQRLAGMAFNAALLNLYRDGRDSVAWHADDEPELGSDPVVASVSFGASRPFDLRPRKSTGSTGRLRIVLVDGSLLIMGNTVQANWLHQLPKVKGLEEPRINLTFRLLPVAVGRLCGDT